MTTKSIAIIGAGFSGALPSLHLLRHCPPETRVVLIERNARFGGGQAYRIDAARARGQLRVRAGRVRGFAIRGGAVEVSVRPRGSDALDAVRAARVVNCPGPGADYDRIAHPLVRSLLAHGAVRPDPLRLGLDVTGTCALLHGDGAISRRPFAVGPVIKAAFWEMTAVPDVRRQCELLAQHLAGPVKATPPAPAPAEVLDVAI